MSQQEIIVNYYSNRSRINNYLLIINICLSGFYIDISQNFSDKDKKYIRKIEDNLKKLEDLLRKLDCRFNENKMEGEKITSILHDLRLSINIVQGYSELILDTFSKNYPTPIGGNFVLIISSAKEILKNLNWLNEITPSS